MALKARAHSRTSENKEAAIKEVTKEKTIRLNANVPESIYQKLKIRAINENVSINDLVIEWITNYLK